MHVLGDKELPCKHQRYTGSKEGAVIRCRICRKKWTARFTLSEWARDHAGIEAYVLGWEDVTE